MPIAVTSSQAARMPLEASTSARPSLSVGHNLARLMATINQARNRRAWRRSDGTRFILLDRRTAVSERELRDLIAAVKAGEVDRRSFVRTLGAFGLSAPFASLLLAQTGRAQALAAMEYKPTNAGGGGVLRTLFWQAPTLINPHSPSARRTSKAPESFTSAGGMGCNHPSAMSDLDILRNINTLTCQATGSRLSGRCRRPTPQRRRSPSSNLLAQYNITVTDYGFCVLPCVMASEDPRLCCVPKDKIWLRRSFWLIVHSDMRDLARGRDTSDFPVEQIRCARHRFVDTIRAYTDLSNTASRCMAA